MPYIKQERRAFYEPTLQKVIEIIKNTGNEVTRVEMVGWFATNLLEQNEPSAFNELLRGEVGFLNSQIGRLPISQAAGEFNYLVSSVAWAILEPDGNYFHRAYLKGLLLNLARQDYKELTPHSQRGITFLGVIHDIIDEMYRRYTSVYEDKKIAENGDCYPERLK